MQLVSKRLKSSKPWLNRHTNDHFVKQSVAEGLRARSAFKLKEIQEKYKLIQPCDFVIDMGASPGLLTICNFSHLEH